MKVKQAKSVDLTADSTYTIPLNTFKPGDTVARELIISYDGSCSLVADDNEPFGIDYELNVDTFTGDGSTMLIPCEMYKEIQVQAYENGTLTYKVLV